MEAIEIKSFGDVDVLQSVESAQPALKAKQVLVKNRAVAIDPYDVKFVMGQMGEADKLPLVPGSSVVGDVIAVGEAVTAFKVGDRVAATRHHHTYASEVVIGQSALALVPEAVNDAVAVAATLGAAMGYQAIVEDLDVEPGQKVLIQGGAGAVGSAAVQVALLRGAEVYATASPADFAYLQSLGAVNVVDYHSDYEAELSDFDAALDTIGRDVSIKSAKILKAGGKLRTVQAYDEALIAQYDIDAEFIFLQGTGVQLAALLDLIAAGKVNIRIAQVSHFNLANLRQAHQEMRKHAPKGKFVLSFVD